jgi:hypothetical protein
MSDGSMSDVSMSDVRMSHVHTTAPVRSKASHALQKKTSQLREVKRMEKKKFRRAILNREYIIREDQARQHQWIRRLREPITLSQSLPRSWSNRWMIRCVLERYFEVRGKDEFLGSSPGTKRVSWEKKRTEMMRGSYFKPSPLGETCQNIDEVTEIERQMAELELAQMEEKRNREVFRREVAKVRREVAYLYFVGENGNPALLLEDYECWLDRQIGLVSPDLYWPDPASDDDTLVEEEVTPHETFQDEDFDMYDVPPSLF